MSSQKPAGTAYDVIVVGLGAMGSAAARELARRGRRVLGLEKYATPHVLGSSHGRSRIIREAYFEHPLYVPLVQRAYDLWLELEREHGRPLLLLTGGLMLGPPDGAVVGGARESAVAHGLPHEELSAAEVRRRFPAFTPSDGMAGLLEPRAGILFPEACVQALREGARGRGAELRDDEPVSSWRAGGGEVEVQTARGRYRAGQLLLAAGAWMPDLLGGLAPELWVERQLFHWFAPLVEGPFAPARCPVALVEFAPGRLFATFPDLGDGVKAGIHHGGERTHPDRVRREPTAEDEAAMRVLVERFLPGAAGPVREARVCLYTNTPDGHFLIDRHPDHPEVLLASPCSGHGFKFASALGEVLAELLTSGRSRFDLAPFRLARLRPAPGRA